MAQVTFPGICTTAWEHPSDKAALNALKKIPGLDEIIRFFIGNTTERSLRLIHLASAVRASPLQFSRVYRMLERSCDILSADYVPEIYVANSPFINAGAIGVNKPFIVLNSTIIDQLSDQEILFIIGHELGHCLSGHALYKTLLYFLINLSTTFVSIPMSQVAFIAIIGALREWDRKSELSADRAGLLVVQDPQVSYEANMKLAGGGNVNMMSINEFFNQAKEYEEGGDMWDSILKILNMFGATHPFPVLRLVELKAWVDSGKYKDILDGNYPRKDKDNKKIFEDIGNAKDQYVKEIKESKDPLTKNVSNFIGNLDEAVGKSMKAFKDAFNDNKPDDKKE